MPIAQIVRRLILFLSIGMSASSGKAGRTCRTVKQGQRCIQVYRPNAARVYSTCSKWKKHRWHLKVWTRNRSYPSCYYPVVHWSNVLMAFKAESVCMNDQLSFALYAAATACKYRGCLNWALINKINNNNIDACFSKKALAQVQRYYVVL